VAWTWPFRRETQTPILLEPAEAYALWASRYPPWPHNALMRSEQTVVLELIGGVSGLELLAAGCGSGRYLRLLAERGARSAGIDRSPAMLAYAREQSPHVVRGDFRALPFASASRDLVVCALALGDIAELGGAMSEMARVLRPGGRLVSSMVHSRGAAEDWTRSFTTEEGCWSVANWWHSPTELVAACASSRLRIDRILEPALDGDDQPVILAVSATRE